MVSEGGSSARLRRFDLKCLFVKHKNLGGNKRYSRALTATYDLWCQGATMQRWSRLSSCFYDE